MTDPASAAAYGPRGQSSPGQFTQTPETTGWAGWVVFAGTLMIMLGLFHAIQGVVALFNDEYFLVGSSGLTVQLDYTAWGWVHLIGGVVVLLAGIGLLAGQTWARVVGILLAIVSAVTSFAFIAAYPVWSSIVIAIDVIIIFALSMHGQELRRR
ncbi:DUF7144 family membrane protein [Krasilnikoviella flava]|uniref:DUF7144 domain-containing protein n=1 Tax=Krasilnikoviella flava TaxID=526729 RepID=A0A1T5L8E2_9MICO|nr:hypothetical protein [Krasilnikoviella flava]SKC72210.1 hypothetical protein SAMN04324258_3121 [Krasilnikoviella flava]